MVDVPGEDPKFGKGSHDEVLFLGVGMLKALRMVFLTQPSKRGIPRSDRAMYMLHGRWLIIYYIAIIEKMHSQPVVLLDYRNDKTGVDQVNYLCNASCQN